MTSQSIDIVTIGVIRELFISAVREMRLTMIKTAHSSVIYEGHDFSCALLDRNAELVAQSEDSPAHIFPLAGQTRQALGFYGDDLHPGDVVLVNDPYTSGTHMNDVAMITPIFAAGRRIAFSVVRGHWADIGGMVPGSISGKATEIFQEGLRIPFVKVFEKGQLSRSVLDLILANVRVADESEGDFYAMVSCCSAGRRRLEEIIARFGMEVVGGAMTEILSRGEMRMRNAIATLQPGIYHFEDYFDSDAVTGHSVLLRIAVTIDTGGIRCDFTGSSRQVEGPINCSLASTATATFTALKALLDPKSPINGGAFRPVAVESPAGTITNVKLPAACGGFGEMRRRIESVTMGALSAAAPRYIAGDTKGSSNHTLIGSVHPGRQRTTVFYEWPAGGTGGFLENDGSHAMRAYDEGDFGSIMPVEAVEQEHALLVEKCELRVDSCGDGSHRGGLGLRREIRLLAESGTFSVLSDRNVVPPFGVCGGTAGAPNRFRVRRGGEEIQPSDLPGKVSGFPLRRNDIVIVESAGGGGYGSPLERKIDAIAEDIAQGYITRERAESSYGVIFANGRIDDARTTAQRRRARDEELRLRVAAEAEDDFVDGRRICRLAESTMVSLGIDSSTAAPALIELINPNGAPLRAWVVSVNGPAEWSVRLGPISRDILGVSEGDSIVVRVLRNGKEPL